MKEPPLNWEKLGKAHKKISILIDNALPEHKGKGKESYVGYVSSIKDDFLFLETPQNTKLDGIVVRLDMILSVWIYKNNG